MKAIEHTSAQAKTSRGASVEQVEDPQLEFRGQRDESGTSLVSDGHGIGLASDHSRLCLASSDRGSGSDDRGKDLTIVFPSICSISSIHLSEMKHRPLSSLPGASVGKVWTPSEATKLSVA